jgi:hypothetical protein
LPACTPDVQKAFYSLLLERRLGEYPLPPGTWVVAAGNRAEDRALVRTISSALVNRVLILHVRIDVPEWLAWARANGVRADFLAFVEQNPDVLLRPVPREAAPFSTPRAWASLSRALDLAERGGILSEGLARALAMGRISPDDARSFAVFMQTFGRPPPPPPEPSAFARLPLAEKLKAPLADLELSVRATNCLESEGICTVGELVVRSEDELLEIRNFGEPTLKQVRDKLAQVGLSLGMKLP